MHEAPDRDAIGRFVLHVARGGVEPPTYRFSVGRSYQLSYLAKRVECYMSATALAESVAPPSWLLLRARSALVHGQFDPERRAATGRRFGGDRPAVALGDGAGQ